MIDQNPPHGKSSIRWRPEKTLICLGLAVGVTCLLGCGTGGEPTYQLNGLISYKDKPVEGGLITFYPASAGRPTGGPFDESGNYSVRLPVGEYDVLIAVSVEVPEGYREGDPLPKTKPRIPPRYAHPKGSGLSVTVKPESSPQQCDFDLK